MEDAIERDDELAVYREVYPDCTDDELVEIRDKLTEYLGIVMRVHGLHPREDE